MFNVNDKSRKLPKPKMDSVLESFSRNDTQKHVHMSFEESRKSGKNVLVHVSRRSGKTRALVQYALALFKTYAITIVIVVPSKEYFGPIRREFSKHGASEILVDEMIKIRSSQDMKLFTADIVLIDNFGGVQKDFLDQVIRPMGIPVLGVTNYRQGCVCCFYDELFPVTSIITHSDMEQRIQEHFKDRSNVIFKKTNDDGKQHGFSGFSDYEKLIHAVVKTVEHSLDEDRNFVVISDFKQYIGEPNIRFQLQKVTLSNL
jgi:hypothetical protein